MIPKVNLGVGDMGFMFRDLYVSLKQPFNGGYNFDEFAMFDFCFFKATHPTLGILVSKLASQISGLYFYSDGGVISIDLANFCTF